MLGFILLHFINSRLIPQSRATKLISRQHLSTFFFDDLHQQITVFGRKITYFFISTDTPNSLIYSINNKDDKTKLVAPKEEKISNGKEFIKLKDMNFSKTIFKLDSKVKSGKEIKSKKTSSISFISFEYEDECQYGIEFISSKKDVDKYRKLSKKCFYLPPDDETPATLFTFSHTFESSLMKRSEAMDFSKIPFQKNIKRKKKFNEQQKVDLKNPNLFIKDKSSRSLLSQNTEKVTSNTAKKQKNIPASAIIGICLALVFTLTFFIFLCASKSGVEADSSPNQSTPITPNTPKTFSPSSPSPYAQACNSEFMHNVYMDPNAYYPNVVQYQGALPMKRHMKDYVANGIMNAPAIPA